ncbi:MAG: prepilin-type N-terminal cleavage/methylation domain-containing protein [Candidatus Omnitrophica bacterium]|nr:prepilin-type N-terminal cleavage/methylation domain-containing protein [Candidatus Omnitrophota bacterium]
MCRIHKKEKRDFLKGFTLVEILIAVSILLIVTGMVSTIFISTLNYWKRGYALSRRQQSARLVFSRMTENISSLFLSSSRNIYCFGSKDKFYFMSASVKGTEGDLAEMGYEFNQADGKLFFYYQEKSDYDFSTYDYKDIIAVDILELNFSYLDSSGNWLDSWDSRVGGQEQGLSPQAIKVYFSVENPDFPDKKEAFETVVELPIRTKYR